MFQVFWEQGQHQVDRLVFEERPVEGDYVFSLAGLQHVDLALDPEECPGVGTVEEELFETVETAVETAGGLVDLGGRALADLDEGGEVGPGGGEEGGKERVVQVEGVSKRGIGDVALGG